MVNKIILAVLSLAVFFFLSEIILEKAGVETGRSADDFILDYQRFSLPLCVPAKDFKGNDVYQTIPLSSGNFLNFRQFPIRKGANTFRIFCLGGSAVKGSFVSPRAAFSSWLEYTLNRLVPEMRFEVINLGDVGKSSDHVLVYAREALKNYDPDLLVVYSGNNEFHQARALKYLNRHLPLMDYITVAYIDFWLSASRTYCLLKTLFRKFYKPDKTLKDSVSLPFLSEREAMRLGRLLADNYRRNLDRLAGWARYYKKDLILSTVAVNYRDFDPSDTTDDIPAAALRRRDELYNRGTKLMNKGEHEKALKEFAAALEGGHDSAIIRFAMGRCYEATGKYLKAREEYLKANDLSVNCLRAKTFLNDIVKEIAASNGVGLAQINESMEAWSDNGLVGNNFFLDYCHFNIAGHRLAAGVLAKAVILRCGFIPDPSDAVIKGALAEYGVYLGLGGNDNMLLKHWLGTGPLFAKHGITPATMEVNSHERLREVLADKVFSEEEICVIYGNKDYDAGNFKPAIWYYRRALGLNKGLSQAYLNAAYAFLHMRPVSETLLSFLDGQDNFADTPGLRQEVECLMERLGKSEGWF